RKVDTGFRKRSCSTNKLERVDDSKKSHPALDGHQRQVALPPPWLGAPPRLALPHGICLLSCSICFLASAWAVTSKGFLGASSVARRKSATARSAFPWLT